MLATTERKRDSRLLDRAALEAEKCRRSFYAFVKMAWPIAVPSAPFVENWHLGAICEHLQAVTEGQITTLLINVPPGCSKSTITGVFWNAWEWVRDPAIAFFSASYEQTLSTRDAVKCRDVIASQWYRERWPDVKIKTDQDEKTYYVTTATGWRLATSIGGRGTGHHPHRKVVDDPHNVRRSLSAVEREAVALWYDQTLSSRGAALGARTVVIMQRLHEEDLSGHMLSMGLSDLVHLCLPMRYEPKRMVTTPLGFNDPRTEPGELLSPRYLDEQKVRDMEQRLGSFGVAGQLQQRPAPARGGVFQREWLGKTWGPEIPADLEQIIQSWDCAFKGTADSDYVVGQVWGKRGAQYLLLDQVRGRMSFSETVRAIERLSEKWPKATAKLVEDKANGTAVIDTLRLKLPGLIPVEPQGGKEARAAAVSPLVEAGNVLLPASAPWVSDYVEEMVAFPRGANDDQVDATTQALLRLSATPPTVSVAIPRTDLVSPQTTFGPRDRAPLFDRGRGGSFR